MTSFLRPTPVIERLFNNSKQGRGTDLEVQCPKKLGESELQSFHLHSCIAAETSEYFDKIILPHANGISLIQEVDAETFELCIRYMYLQKLAVTHENVTAVLAAADFLDMKDLKTACFDYLDRNLDHENYETVKEIAEHHDNPALSQRANMFATLGGAQKELYECKIKAEGTLETVRQTANKTSNVQGSLKRDLRALEGQIKHSIRQNYQLNPNNMHIRDFSNDPEKDFFNQLLRHSKDDEIGLGQVITRKLQKMDPGAANSVKLAETEFPSGFKLDFIWKSRAAFMQAVKNLNKKLSENKRNRDEELTFKDKLDKHTDSFRFTDGSYDTSGLECGDINRAVDALFDGFSIEGVMLLKQWRLDYLAWRRLKVQFHCLEQGKQARESIREIFSNPRGTRTWH